MKSAKRKFAAVALALSLAMLVAGPALQAGASVDLTRPCTLEIGMAEDQVPDVAAWDADTAGGSYAQQLTVTTSLYRVASVDTYYQYTWQSGLFAAEPFDLSGFASALPADQLEMAQKTQSALFDGSAVAPAADASISYAGDKTGKLEKSLSGSELLPGLYLMLTTATDPSGYYDYTFSPVLLSLPSMAAGNAGYQDGADIYDLTGEEMVSLKCDATPKTGSLVIEKRLPEYSTMQGTASFIFSVEATLDYTENGVTTSKTVYSNMLQLNFDAPGVQQLVVDGLPCGATVTVQEVYAGSCYTIDASTKELQTVVIPPKPDDTEPSVSVTFQNDYNGRKRHGTSIVNYLYHTVDGWQWEQQPAQPAA